VAAGTADAIIRLMDDDWRLTPANEKLFRGAKFVQKTFENDHDHCAFCWAEFAPTGAPVHTEPTFNDGYCAAGPPVDPKDDYYWVCPPCFEDLRDRLGWTLRPSNG
jgi:hypothetical protein